jgi:flagellar biosynthesis GTPase FlhF
MKPLVVLLLMTVTVQAQTLAEIARKERMRQAAAKSTLVVTTAESPAETPKAEEPKSPALPADQAKPADAKTPAEPSKDVPKPQVPPSVDPVQVWNNQAEQLRAKIRNLQDQELALLLQQNQVRNQVYAPVIDPATQDRLRAQLGEIDNQLVTVIKDIDDTKKALDAMLLQGPPKK